MSHHAVSYDDNLLEAAEDLADFFCCEPALVAAARYEQRSETNTTTTRDCFKHVGACGAERSKRSVQVQAGDLAIGIIAVLVLIEDVRRVLVCDSWRAREGQRLVLDRSKFCYVNR